MSVAKQVLELVFEHKAAIDDSVASKLKKAQNEIKALRLMQESAERLEYAHFEALMQNLNDDNCSQITLQLFGERFLKVKQLKEEIDFLLPEVTYWSGNIEPEVMKFEERARAYSLFHPKLDNYVKSFEFLKQVYLEMNNEVVEVLYGTCDVNVCKLKLYIE